MVAAGILNAVALYSLAKSLQLIPVAHANALNASQTAMAALLGVLLFGETWGPELVGGVALMVIGLMLIRS